MLTWLLNRVTYLANRITTLWNAAWDWAVYHARKAYNDAVAWAISRIGVVTSTVWNLYHVAKTHATNLFNTVSSNILYWYNRAVGAAQALVAGLKALVLSLFNQAKTFTIDYANRVIAGWNIAYNWIKDRLVKIWNDVVVFVLTQFDRAVAAAKAIVDGSAAVINALINRGKVEIEELKVAVGIDEPVKQGTLLHFLQSPGSFILAYMWNMFLEFLEWSLAYAIGSVDDALPPLPDWFSEGRGGAVLTGIGPPPGSSGLAPPLDKVYVSGYIFRQGHRAIDLGLQMGTPVYAMHSGIVEIANWSTIGYGFYVTIRSNEWWTLYAHLDVINVSPGQRVAQSDTIGLGNSTGNSTGPHLHLEIKHRGTYIDPMTVL